MKARSMGAKSASLQLTRYEFTVVYMALSRMLDSLSWRHSRRRAFDPNDLQFTRFETQVLSRALMRASAPIAPHTRTERAGGKRAA